MRKIFLEYVWLDGYSPEPNLRSKVKIVNYEDVSKGYNQGIVAPEWNFDGSSTKQAETGNSDRILKPVASYIKDTTSTIYILCEVMNPDGTPHETNTRSRIGEEETTNWFGFEQEYFIREGKNMPILGHSGRHDNQQGKFYCGVGANVVGREFVEKHTNMCLEYGIDITGTNAEVALGQWEYQVFSKGRLKAGDDLWMSRYFLHKISEEYGYEIDLHPKPIQHGEWNGSGLHTNFSTEFMREVGGEEYFQSLFSSFEARHNEHIKNYGSSNELRLTGKFETQSIDKFSVGVSDRGASIRVPAQTAVNNWKGYIEDRRPASNADPYKIIYEICLSIANSVIINKIKHKMNFKLDMDNLKNDFKTLSNEELLKEYLNDDEYELDSETMNGSNVPIKELKFNLKNEKNN